MIIDEKEYEIQMKGRTFHCALDVTMSYIGGKWKSVILWYLRNDVKRFSELRRHVPGITEKMLSLQLRELEKDGVVARKIYPEVPPRVEYFLTEEGKTMLPLLEELAAWGRYMSKKYGEIREKVTGEPKPEPLLAK